MARKTPPRGRDKFGHFTGKHHEPAAKPRTGRIRAFLRGAASGLLGRGFPANVGPVGGAIIGGGIGRVIGGLPRGLNPFLLDDINRLRWRQDDDLGNNLQLNPGPGGGSKFPPADFSHS